MQTIKCVVVGDGAVGKVRPTPYENVLFILIVHSLDLSFDLVHNEQVSQRICPYRMSASHVLFGIKLRACPPSSRSSITTL